MLKICISGYGRMGKSIEIEALKKGHQIHCIVDNKADWIENETKILESDVIIDFSFPDSIIDIIDKSSKLNIPLVSGTTGWHTEKENVEAKLNRRGATMVYASNFSIGMNILFALNETLAKVMNRFEDYSVAMEETHHTQKLDSPSGTAISLANQIIEHNERLSKWKNTPSDLEEMLPIVSHRIEGVIGDHNIKYKSEIDEIQIGHRAITRTGFALGAIYAAERISALKGLIEFKDILNLNI